MFFGARGQSRAGTVSRGSLIAQLGTALPNLSFESPAGPRHNRAIAPCRVPAMADPFPFKYRAFISYSHVDTSWAKWLHRALEGFPIDKDLVGREMASGTIPKTLRPTSATA